MFDCSRCTQAWIFTGNELFWTLEYCKRKRASQACTHHVLSWFRSVKFLTTNLFTVFALCNYYDVWARIIRQEFVSVTLQSTCFLRGKALKSFVDKMADFSDIHVIVMATRRSVSMNSPDITSPDSLPILLATRRYVSMNSPNITSPDSFSHTIGHKKICLHELTRYNIPSHTVCHKKICLNELTRYNISSHTVGHKKICLSELTRYNIPSHTVGHKKICLDLFQLLLQLF